jgi:hypothetical protein
MSEEVILVIDGEVEVSSAVRHTMELAPGRPSLATDIGLAALALGSQLSAPRSSFRAPPGVTPTE